MAGSPPPPPPPPPPQWAAPPSLDPSMIKRPVSQPPPPSRVALADFDYANPSYGKDYTSYDADFRVDLTTVTEKDDMLTEPASSRRSRSLSAAAAGRIPRLPLTRARKSSGSVEEGQDGSLWPGLSRFLLRLLIVISSAVIIGLITHSLHIFATTQELKLPDTDSGSIPAWGAKKLHLFPTVFLLCVAALNLVLSITSIAFSYRRKFSAPLAPVDKWAIGTGVLSLFAWALGAAFFKLDEGSSRAHIGYWACYHKNAAPGLVDFTAVCNEQHAAQYLSSALTVVELLILLTFAYSATISRRVSPVGLPGFGSR